MIDERLPRPPALSGFGRKTPVSWLNRARCGHIFALCSFPPAHKPNGNAKCPRFSTNPSSSISPNVWSAPRGVPAPTRPTRSRCARHRFRSRCATARSRSCSAPKATISACASLSAASRRSFPPTTSRATASTRSPSAPSPWRAPRPRIASPALPTRRYSRTPCRRSTSSIPICRRSAYWKRAPARRRPRDLPSPASPSRAEPRRRRASAAWCW